TAAERGSADVVEAVLKLGMDAEVVAVGIDRHARLDRGRQLAAELLLDGRAQPLHAPLVDQELDAGAGALGALALVAEDLGDRAADVRRLLRQREHVQPAAHLGGGAQAAADPDVVADDTVLVHRDQADVVDLVLGATMRAGRDRDLELAREVGYSTLA